MTALLEPLAGLVCAAICVRILAHPHHQTTTHTWLDGLLAWLLMSNCGGLAINLLFARTKTQLSAFDLIVLSLLAILVFRSKGCPGELFGVKR